MADTEKKNADWLHDKRYDVTVQVTDVDTGLQLSATLHGVRKEYVHEGKGAGFVKSTALALEEAIATGAVQTG